MINSIKDFGIGTDIENIDRFRKLDYNESRAFLNKIFTENELDYCFSKETPAQHLAARFAGKEAVVKALSDVGKFNINYKEIEIINNEKGVPRVIFNNKNLINLKVNLSLSHCDDKAIAFAIIIKN